MTIHRFTPTHYYRAIGTYEPVLSVAPGDTVLTSCVDAVGQDAARAQVTPRSNPMTGPFFIAGAEPGDTLVVRLEAIVPNRTYGWSGRYIETNVVEPDFVRELPFPGPDEPRRAEWHVDAAAGTATLVHPQGNLGPVVLPLSPMLGCFGVAPADGEAISTTTSGPHGGNMDYRGFVAGVTVYFPVFVPGAFFFLGDGHAVQGAGEIAGTGIEVSCDVQFTVGLQKGRRSHWPRGETASHIFTVGNARPLDQAVQHATTEMLRWWQEELGIDPAAGQTLLGQVVDYDLGNIYDPAYTMVCKVPKQWLPTPRRREGVPA
jgi:acetamidase/formamidase